MENYFLDNCCEQHAPKHDPYVHETTKVAEILDCFGQMRFKVLMLDIQVPSQHCKRYCITVESFCYKHSPVVILKEFRQHFCEANELYEKCVKQYKHLAIAETRHFQDIKIYADKIGYHKIDPDCCKNCKWSKMVCRHSHHCYEEQKFLCTNHKLFMLECCEDPKLMTEPIVQSDGICKHYCRNHC